MWQLTTHPAADRTDLLAAPVAAAVAAWKHPTPVDRVQVAAIDPDLADTANFCAAYGVPLDASANCVVIAARRGGRTRLAACVVLATTRADVNGVVRRRLEARKASFAPQDEAVRQTGMEYGGITPVGLPEEWPVLVDAAVVARSHVVVGSGLRRSKLVLPGAALAELPNAQVVEDLARPV
ncbi:YbaK/EbsC family protein [Thermobifida halotolerans]|uniref:YbaK/EbsC family protein n=1 Tax=Thermobifida halotolerans TaxID=483545 RepID=A0A399G498_9ACTN|nr:YbaK/EbsC family protein [Thermobifida halotolerans]UOE19674.1 YbaK/EbsC family protein [Thermobifida halotolerans]